MTDARTAHFDRLYRDTPDPWHYRTSAYERAKYASTLAALPLPRYQSAIEAGCANGELGALLAARCDRYLGMDCAGRAVEEARRRLRHLPNARVRQGVFPTCWPKRRADLVVLSEVLYYLDEAELEALAERLHDTLLPGGEVIIVNWTGETDTALSGAQATRIFAAALTAMPGYARVLSCGQEGYDLLLLRRTGDATHPAGHKAARA